MKRKLKPQAIEGVEASSAEEQPLYFKRKQLRSRLTRRRRRHISPIVLKGYADSHITAASELSCDSSIASVSNQNPSELPNEFRRVVTRSYSRKRFIKEKKICNEPMELSDYSCVESSSGTNRELKRANVEELEVHQGDVTKSEVSSASRYPILENDIRKVKEKESSSTVTQNETVFEIPNVNRDEITSSEVEKGNSLVNGDVPVHSAEEITFEFSDNIAAPDELQHPKLAPEFDLTCPEKLSNGGFTNDDGEEEEHNSSSSGIIQIVSDSEFGSSEYSPSCWSYASGSQFSEKSSGDENSSPTFELFRKLKQQFCRSTVALKSYDDHSSHDIIVLGLEDEEDEESYQMMRKRERRQEYVHDYAGEYCNTTEHGDLVIQQRIQMVHWIVQQATNKDLQKETMFLGVGLLDRFLSKGYFKNVSNLQIAGIACLTLATRIEENQPNNCVRRKTFNVGGTQYGRCEVVAMEWLVQEVLNFQCFLPTLYNFLWFYLKAAKVNENVERTAKYLAVLTLMGHQQLTYWPSTIAAGLVILASIATNQDASCQLIMEIHAKQKDDDLPRCVESLEWLVKYL